MEWFAVEWNGRGIPQLEIVTALHIRSVILPKIRNLHQHKMRKRKVSRRWVETKQREDGRVRESRQRVRESRQESEREQTEERGKTRE